MTTDAIHRKIKTREENKKDFYQTPPCLVEALISGLNEVFLGDWQENSKLLDPCCGDLSITNVLRKYYDNVSAYDLYSDKGDKVVDFMDVDEEFDVIIMNPPFSSKREFIDKALEIANFVCVLLPVNDDNYNITNDKYCSDNRYVGCVRTWPKFFMTDTTNDTNIKWGGTTAYKWHVLSNGSECVLPSSPLVKFEVIKDIRKFIGNNK